MARACRTRTAWTGRTARTLMSPLCVPERRCKSALDLVARPPPVLNSLSTQWNPTTSRREIIAPWTLRWRNYLLGVTGTTAPRRLAAGTLLRRIRPGHCSYTCACACTTCTCTCTCACNMLHAHVSDWRLETGKPGAGKYIKTKSQSLNDSVGSSSLGERNGSVVGKKKGGDKFLGLNAIKSRAKSVPAYGAERRRLVQTQCWCPKNVRRVK